MKPPAGQPAQGHGLLLKGDISLTREAISSPTHGGSCRRDRRSEQTWIYTKDNGADRKEGDWRSSAWEERTGRYVYQQCQQMELGKAGQVIISRMLRCDIIDSARA